MNRPLRSPWRWCALVLLLITSLTHVLLIGDHLEEAPYIGVLFIALSVVSVAFAALLVVWDTPTVWAASGLITLLAVLAFLASRTVGLPGIADDIGNWTEPLGFPAVAAEVLTTVVAALVLSHRTPAHRKVLT